MPAWFERFLQDVRHGARLLAKSLKFYAARGTALLGVATELISALGLMGTILTMVGLYGLVSYSVGRRTREIGIRIAIGASYWRVLRMILHQGMRPAWVGLPVGLLLSVVTVRVLPTIFPTGERTNAAMFAIIVPALLIVALMATAVHARRAALVDPTVALRHD
jgi:putative ABC transport system permease protein